MNELNTLHQDILDLEPELHTAIVNLGTEAISFDTLRDHFSKVNKQALGILGWFKKEEEFRIVSISLRDITLSKDVQEAGYMALRDVKVYKPSSFVGDVYKFVRMLDSVSGDVILLESALADFEHTLANLVHTPEDLTKLCTGIKSVKLLKGKSLLNDFGDYFMGKGGIDTAPMKNLYPNLRTIKETGSLLLELTEKFNGNDVAMVKTRGDSLYKTLEYLEEELASKGLEMTTKWRRAIGKELYTLTEWLGIYSLFITKLVSVSVAHRDTIIKLNDM